MESCKICFCNRCTRIFDKLHSYLTDLVNDISLGQFTIITNLMKSAFAASIRYFGLGKIELRQTRRSQREFYYRFAKRICNWWILFLETWNWNSRWQLLGRFINFNLKVASGNNDASICEFICCWRSWFYQSEEIAYNEFNGRWRAGFNIQKTLGPKISYDNDNLNNNFLPANLKI